MRPENYVEVGLPAASSRKISIDQVSREDKYSLKRILLAALISSFAVGSALAQSCETKAVAKDGKALSGAAKSSFVKKCKQDACETKAVSKDGKPLSGAAKNSFMTKCEKDA
jgi:hypothetical protein